MNLHAAWRRLMEQITQDARLIQLHLGESNDDVAMPARTLLAERLDVQEAIGPTGHARSHAPFAWPAGTRIVVHALAEDAGLDLDRMLCRPAQVVLQTQHSPRSWHGHVSQAERLGSDGGLARYRLVLQPWLGFMAHSRDDRKFKDRSIPQILDEVFSRYRARGALDAAWRFDLADPSAYPSRSDCSQYGESDLDFAFRLMREEGLFCWFEHRGASGSARLGSHELVVADHNGAMSPASPTRIRYMQAHLPGQDEGITRWRRHVQVCASHLEIMSVDRRAHALCSVSQRTAVDAGIASAPTLSHGDLAGVYAYPGTTHGNRLALRQMQAIDSQRESFSAVGNVRTTAPGQTFTLCGHPAHPEDDEDRDRFLVLGVHHQARSNLPADIQAAIDARWGSLWTTRGSSDQGHSREESVHTCRMHLQRAGMAVRPAKLDSRGQPDPRLHPQRRAWGVQTGIVVSAGGAVESDRDHHVKVRHHWQRGTAGSHPLPPAEDLDNAPGGDAFASLAPVVEPLAGANWGSHFIKRAHQEVVIGHLHGQPDRGVILGAVYNGRGREDSMGNEVVAGAGDASGNAPGWFPGKATHGPWSGHRHGAVLTGFKSQGMGTSDVGGGAANTFVFTDEPQESRIELSTTTGAARMQLGNLGHLNGNELLEHRGSGLSLETTDWGALRAGAGLLLSAQVKPGTTEGTQQLEVTEPLRQIAVATDRLHALAESAQRQNATLPGDPDMLGSEAHESKRQLPSERGCRALAASLSGTDHRGEATSATTGSPQGSGATDAARAIGGGGGTISSWTRPDVLVAAPGGVGSFTPAHTVVCAGETLNLIAQDVQHLAQGDHAVAVAQGLVLYTQGRATGGATTGAEGGIRVHAAMGGVRIESQTGSTRLTSNKDLTVASASGALRITSPQHVLLTAAGAALQIDPGGITLKGPGKVEFRAAMKEFAGPATASAAVEIREPGKLAICRYRLAGALDGIEGR